MIRSIQRIVRAVVTTAGLFCILALALCFTAYPWRALTWLGSDAQQLQGAPDFIVLLSGGGIPSESGLMRSYEAAALANRHPSAAVIVAMPEEADEETSSTRKMFDELVLRGVVPARLRLEGSGRNTREQAVNIRTMLGPATNQPALLICTSPDHMKRSLLSFRKAGFTHVYAAPAYDVAVNVDLRYDAEILGPAPLANIGKSLEIRYKFWNNLVIECRIVREFFALGYYKINGWI